ncbi:hypothetical protein EKH55_4593 [Sinorhizobium alkalisoli]|nr:hypothetical protein EKH55_4593 [Sinorhizobium alkalisoli]
MEEPRLHRRSPIFEHSKQRNPVNCATVAQQIVPMAAALA